MQHSITALVENRPGVLARVTGLFARRGFNIESLAVSITEDPTVSRITLVVGGDGKVYCLNETGSCTVLDAKSDTHDVIAVNDLGEGTLGTPAIANGMIYIHSEKALYGIGK